MDSEISKYIKDLRHAATSALLNYEVWWTYVEEDSRKKYVSTMNNYTLFFQASIKAHFLSLIISLYRLYENNSKTVNIPGLLKLIKTHQLFKIDTEKSVVELYNKAEPLFVKVAILRNNEFGHRSAKLSAKDAFSKADITPNELKGLIDLTKELLNAITLEWDQSFHAFNLGSRESTIKLLDDLTELNEARSDKKINRIRR